MNEVMQQEKEVPTQKTCWELLERVVNSSQLRRSARLQNLLLYVGRRTLREGTSEIHEQEIGIEVYGRPAGYDTNVDNIVRVNASELRKRVASYFDMEGSDEPLLMEIPRGKYVPCFQYRPVEQSVDREQEPIGPVAISPAAEEEEPSLDVPVIPGRHRGILTNILTWSAIAVLVIACGILWYNNRELQRAVHPWRYEPLIARVWSGFLDDGRDTDIVMEDSSFLLVQNLDKRTFTLNEYLSRSYLDNQTVSGLSPEMQDIQKVIGGKTLARAAEVRLIQRILTLDLGSKNLHIYNGREYIPGLINRDNVILLGNPTSNPWFQVFQFRLNFRQQADSQSESQIFNVSPTGHEQEIYKPTTDIAYGIVANLPKPDQNGDILLVEGTSSEATEACGNFVLSEEELLKLSNLLHTKDLPYFELLLKVSHLTGTPISTSIEAYRVYPRK